MTKQELEKAIENGESVWGIYFKTIIYELKAKNIQKISKGEIEYLDKDKDFYLEVNLIDIYKTKAEAEHYLHHANVVRTEELPFLTWEEFVKNKKFYFYDASFVLSKLSVNDEKIVLSQAPDSGEWDILKPIKEWDLTEANFYKAYDECVRLFKGEE